METVLTETAKLTASFVLTHLTPAIESIWKNEEAIKALAETVELIRCVLSDVHGKQFKEESVNYGYKRLREAFLDAEDFLDKVETLRKKQEAEDAELKEEEDVKKMEHKVQQSLAGCQVKMKSIYKKMRHCFSKYNPIDVMKNNNEIEKIKKTLEAISKDLKDFGLKEAIIEPDVTQNARGIGSRVDATEIIGRDQDKSEIVSLLLALSDDQKAIRAVSIVGMGGMGKTTLAQLVFNDIILQEGCKFDMKLWASDCKKFELKWLLKKLLLSKHPGTNMNHEDLDCLMDMFVKEIRGKKVFLVLDDVEVEGVHLWEKLMLLLKEGNEEDSRIMVTTRSKEVASCIGANNTIHQLKGISEDDSWSLFERCANLSGNKNREKLIQIGKGIVERCFGVPLAIKVIGSYLQKEGIRTWEYVRDRGLNEKHNSIIPILKISYDGLDSKLKQCFSLCAVFPKNFEISLPVLSNIWITNVRFKEENVATPQQVCKDNLKILCERFFIEDISDSRYGSYLKLKMHDLMHDLSTNVAGEEIRVVKDLKSVVEENVRHLTFDHDQMKYDGNLTFEPKGRRLRTLLLLRGWEILSVDQLVTACPFLRVLDLKCSGIKKLTNSTGKLIHLRYLDISGNEFETLPDSVTKLINLRYLNLAFCLSLTCLPNRIDALTSLEELDLQYCSKLKQLPTGIGKLTNLRYLNLKLCSSLTCLPDRVDALTSLEELHLGCCLKLKQLPTDIVKLTNLKNLNIEYCRGLTEMPLGMCALMPLCTPSIFIVGLLESKNSAQLQELELLSELKEGKLIIQLPSKTALKVGGDSEAYLVNKKWLRDLQIEWEVKREEDIEVEAENHIDILAKLQPPTDLEKLSLLRYPDRTFPPWVPKGDFSSVLPNLVQMILSGCGKCQHLPPLSRLLCLRYLYLEDLKSLEYIEEDNSIASTASFCPCLEEIDLENLPELKGWCRVLDNSGHEKQSLMLPSFPQLNSLTITSCSNLRVSPLLFSFVKVLDSSQTSSVPFFDQVVTNSGSFWLCLEQEIDKHSLSLIVSNFNFTESSSIYMDEAFRGKSDRLTYLHIQECSGLKTLPTGLQHLTAIQELVIEDCCDFTREEDDYDEQSLEHQQTCSYGEMSRKPLESLRKLTLQNLPMMVRLPKWIQLVTSLTELTLNNLPKMETLPEWIQILTNLQKLDTNLTLPVCLHSTFENKEYYDGSYYYVRIKASLEVKE